MSIELNELRELELSIADRIYIKVANWHLYLGDAGLAKDLAMECKAHLGKGTDVAARKALEAIQVEFGGGNTRLPLARLIPPGQIFDLEELLEPYSR
tara:strand:- start:234 stop:524 length:291 start_codon:yes stop_codon:yes gene_type:complete